MAIKGVHHLKDMTDEIISIEDMAMHGNLPPSRCIDSQHRHSALQVIASPS